jgi:hypothetical protein
LLARALFAIETLWRKTPHILFSIEVDTRRIRLAGCWPGHFLHPHPHPQPGTVSVRVRAEADGGQRGQDKPPLLLGI